MCGFIFVSPALQSHERKNKFLRWVHCEYFVCMSRGITNKFMHLYSSALAVMVDISDVSDKSGSEMAESMQACMCSSVKLFPHTSPLRYTNHMMISVTLAWITITQHIPQVRTYGTIGKLSTILCDVLGVRMRAAKPVTPYMPSSWPQHSLGVKFKFEQFCQRSRVPYKH
jgi:hypothetical protein